MLMVESIPVPAFKIAGAPNTVPKVARVLFLTKVRLSIIEGLIHTKFGPKGKNEVYHR